jgi:hypothetical protein
MKNLVRAFALALVVTGAVATTHTASAHTLTPRLSNLPVPVCPPDSPDGCGVCAMRGCNQ